MSRELHLFHHFPDDHEVRRLLHTLVTQGETIMAKLDDLIAAQAATSAALDAIGTNVGDLTAGVTALDAEVKALIALIGATPDVPQAVVDAATALQAKSEALVAATQGVEDQIAQIPKAPTP